MKQFITPIIITAFVSTCTSLRAQPVRYQSQPKHEIPVGFVTMNDGSFNYQGYLEINGEPANGMYSFRFEAFEEPTGGSVLHELRYEAPPVEVINGLFVVDIQMGADPDEARRFWREVGDEEMFLEIGVSEFFGGPYTTLNTRARVGWSARAQYSGISEALQFPYTAVFDDGSGDAVTMLSLTSAFGGTLLELIQDINTTDPILDIQGNTPFGFDFGSQNGALRIDASEELVGLLAASSQYPVVALLEEGASSPFAAMLAQVDNNVVAYGAQIINLESDNDAYLATPDHAGDFRGDVYINGNLQVEGEPVRDFGSNMLSPIGPIAYASISDSGAINAGTSNLSATWNATGEYYEITVTGETLTFQTCVAVVNIIDLNSPRVATTNAVSGKLRVKIWNLNATNDAIQDNFHVVIYKPDPSAFLLNPPPPGVDPESYYAQTGTRSIVGTTTTPAPEPRPRPTGIGN